MNCSTLKGGCRCGSLIVPQSVLAHDRVDIKNRACFFEPRKGIIDTEHGDENSNAMKKRIDGDVEVVMLTGYSFVEWLLMGWMTDEKRLILLRPRSSRQVKDALKHKQWCYRWGIPRKLTGGSGYVI
jgi:hypothetical protein